MSVNINALEEEISWYSRVQDVRLKIYFEQTSKDSEGEHSDIYSVVPPVLDDDQSEYAQLVQSHDFQFDERLILILALIPHLRPQILEILLITNKNTGRNYAEFGGWKGKVQGGFLPTCETAAFLLAGNDLDKRIEIMRYFDESHPFIRQGLLMLGVQDIQESLFSFSLGISVETLKRCTTGVSHQPDFSAGFPAKRIESHLVWQDLVLAPDVMDEVANVGAWIQHQETIMLSWGLGRIIKPGYRALFYGPPGTGKTLTAVLLGAQTGMDVYRIDLSQVVSKYIGETEKNLSNVFNQAERKNWILFFDEADALFGKRTHAASANDRYANQEVAYLLQRIEDFSGVVILASNIKANIDDAFARRFQSLVHFSMPDVDERYRLWHSAFNGQCKIHNDVCYQKLAETYELSGGGIINVIRYAALSALRRASDVICFNDLVTGVNKELRKEGKTL